MNSSSSPSVHRRIKDALIHSLCEDLPLLQYGSGDFPTCPPTWDGTRTTVEPTTQLLAQLTVEYIERLVRAAVEAQDLLLDGVGGILPPIRRSAPRPTIISETMLHPDPYPYSIVEEIDKTETVVSAAVSKNRSTSSSHTQQRRQQERAKVSTKRNKRKGDCMNWEMELPKPIITRHRPNDTQDDDDTHRLAEDTTDKKNTKNRPILQGVSHSRTKHIFCYPTTHYIPMNVECFLFPISHDTILYSRVLELLSLRWKMLPHTQTSQHHPDVQQHTAIEYTAQDSIFIDPTLVSMIQMEQSELVE